MNKRAEYYAKKDARFADYLTEGRAFGPHGADLVIANSIAHYDDTLSRELTDLTVKANLAIRELGFKPYLGACLFVRRVFPAADAAGCVALQLGLLWERCRWARSSVCATAWSAEQVEYEDLLLPPALYARIEHAYHNLCALI